MNELDHKYEEEIELIDILRVIWKWKYLIVAGTLLCMIAAALVSSLMAKTYQISMVMEPGILKIMEDGERVSVDTPQNIKALIETGAFNHNILNTENASSNGPLLRSLSFKVNIPNDSNTLKVFYKTSDIESGMRILNYLQDFLVNRYDELVDYSKNEYDKQIKLIKTDIADIEAKIQAEKKQILNIKNRIKTLRSKLDFIKNNSQALIQERDKFLSNRNSENNILSALLYTNTIQQNLQVEDQYMKDLHDYLARLEDSQLKVDNRQIDLTRLFAKIRDLEYKKKKIQNIQMVQGPRQEPNPVSPKKKLNVLLAAVLGLFFTTFLAFFLEYLQKHKR